MRQESETNTRLEALNYHEKPKPGKLEVKATKPLDNGRDLSRAYSPGVAEASLEIHKDPSKALRFTSKGNLVAVVTNGSAVLGLGDIGALASKPVMEGKAVLFKKFANIDCFDIEINQSCPKALAETICSLEPTFGAINLEDIKAPDCFIVEQICRSKMKIPVFHDDQHGTAIVVGAALTNALKIAQKSFDKIKVVSTGGGAAGIACLNILVKLGVLKKNIWLCDIHGLVFEGRTEDMNNEKVVFAQRSSKRTLDEVIKGADLFLGLSGPNVLTTNMVKKMASKPIIFALANPTPEIMPNEVKKVSPDAIVATGRSDFPNQVNNVLCFPFIFRGALDVGATDINDEMKLACIKGIAELARATTSAEVAAAYQDEKMTFGANYLIPKPFDPRLSAIVSSAVAEAAIKTGVATREITDFEAYRQHLKQSVFKSALLMRPIFEAASKSKRRLVFSEGEDDRVLRAAQAILEETSELPILIGRPQVILKRCEQLGLNIDPLEDLKIVNPESDCRYRDYWQTYHKLLSRKGVSPDLAKTVMRTNTTAIGSLMVHRKEADSLICGTFGEFHWHLKFAEQILCYDKKMPIGALSMIILNDGPIFVADTEIWSDPSPKQIAEIAIRAANHVKRFGINPKVAICSQSEFGNLDNSSGQKMREAMHLLNSLDLSFDCEGEMNVDAALDQTWRDKILPSNRFAGSANVLIFPNADTASAVRGILKMRADGLEVGPILMGMRNSIHIVSPTITTRGILNMAAIAGTEVAHYD